MILSHFVVIYDACVLYPAPLRDLLMHLSMTGLYRAKWTNKIHDEWISNLLQDRPDLTLVQLTRTRQLMDSHVDEAIVEGYEPRIESLILPDPDDRHVLAAAIECNASLIVTWNITDFPNEALKSFGIVAITPDDFVLDQIELSADLVIRAVRHHKDSLTNPSLTWDQYFSNLANQGLARSVERLNDLISDWKIIAI